VPAILAPLAHPLFRRFFAGQVVSKAGDTLFWVALPWQVILLGGGAAEIGAVLTAALVAQVVFSVIGGVLVDRWPRKRVVVASDVLQGLVVAAAGLLALTGSLTLPGLVALAALFGAFQAIAFPATGAFLPDTVPKEVLGAANSLFQGTTIASSTIGALAGGLLLAWWGPWSAFFANALTFAVSAPLLASIRMAPRTAPRGPPRSVLAEARAGWRYVAATPWLWIGIALFALFNAAEASPRNVLLPVLVGVELGGGAIAFGLVGATFRAGTLVGSFLPGLLPPFKRPGLSGYATVSLVGFLIVGVALSTSVWQVAALYFGQGLCFGVFGVIWSTSIGSFVDERMRGRVISIDMLGSLSLMPVTAALVGGVSLVVGLRPIFLAGGLIVLAIAGVGLASRRARTFGPAAPAEPIPDGPA